MDDKIVLLAKPGLWWVIKVMFWAPFWAFSFSPTKKTWLEFKAGLINHKHDYDYDKPVYEKYIYEGSLYESKHYACKHYGCTIINMREKDGTWIESKKIK